VREHRVSELATSSRRETVGEPDGCARERVVVHQPEERRRRDERRPRDLPQRHGVEIGSSQPSRLAAKGGSKPSLENDPSGATS
jgi:hypothetical protein